MLGNFIYENVTAPGIGAVVNLAGSIPGRIPFVQRFSNGAPCFYFLDDGSQAEWGIGTFATGTPNTVSRTTILGNTAGNTLPLNFSATTRMYNAMPAERAIYSDLNNLVTLPGGLSVPGAISGVGVTSLFASPPPIGSVTRNTGSFTTVTAGQGVTVGGNTVGTIGMYPGNASVTGYLGFLNPANTTLYAYIGQYPIAGGAITLVVQNGCTGFNVTGYLQSTTGRIISYSGGQSSITCYDTASGAVGMWASSTAGVMGLGAMDASGNPVATWATLAASGMGLAGALTCTNITATGNFNLSGTMTSAGAITAGSGAIGKSAITAGDASHAGYLEFLNTANARVGYIGYGPTAGGNINLYAESPMTGFQVTGAFGVSSTLVVSGAVNFTSTLSVTNNIVGAGAIISTGQRLISQGTGPSITNYNTQGWAHGIWSPGANTMAFGAMDGSGNASAQWVSFGSNYAWFASTSEIQFVASGSARFQYWSASLGYYWSWAVSNGDLSWVRANAAFWTMRNSDNLCFNNIGTVGGNGAYYNYSDARGKSDIEPTPYGLDEIMRLRPVRFRRIKSDDEIAPLELGFVAQDVERVIPEMVMRAGFGGIDGEGSLDSDDPMRAISETSLIGVLVNAIQALTSRVATLEGRI
jgi:hypothetical protein